MKILLNFLVSSLEQSGAFWKLEGNSAADAAAAALSLASALLAPPPLALVGPLLPPGLSAGAVLVLKVLWRGCRGGNVAVLGGRGDAPLPQLVEHEHGGAPLEAGVAALARPVSVAGLA